MFYIPLALMKYFWLIVFVSVWLGFSGASYVNNQVIVQYAPSGISLFSTDSYSSNSSFEVLELQGWETVEDAILRLQNQPWVIHVQPNYIYQLFDYPPNDQYFDQQWYLRNIGQTLTFSGGAAGTSWADIDWLAGMLVFSGIDNSSLVQNIVAVIDNGVLYTHPDLANKMWDGTNCVNTDWSPLWNCIHGYDIYDNDTNPIPVASDRHWTAVAGIIAAQTNNSIGIAGVNPHSRIMALRVAQGNNLSTTDVVSAIEFAGQNWARIINASFGWTGGVNDTALKNAIENFDGLFIASAGNYAWDHSNPSEMIYPCGYSFTNIICVAATDQNDNLASFSDYGSGVDLAAPGEDIVTTMNNNGSPSYVYAWWTSFSTPIVVGIASLLWSWYPDLDRSLVNESILIGVDTLASLNGLVETNGRANLYNSFVYLQDQLSPYPFTFDSLTWVLPNTSFTSTVVTITGTQRTIPVSVSTGEYRINGWAWSGAWMTGYISSGDTLELSFMSPDWWLVDSMTVTVWEYNTDFTLQSLSERFSFDSLTWVLPLTVHESDIVMLTWFVDSLEVVINNGEYRINGGSWSSTTWSVVSWDTLQLSTTSSWVPDQFDGVYVSVGDYSANFLVAVMESWLLPWEDVFFTWDRRHYNTTGISLFIESDTGVNYRIFGQNLMTEYSNNLWSDFNEIVLELNGTTGITYIWTVLGSGWDERYFTDYVVYDIQAPILESVSLTSGQTVYWTSVFVTGTVSDDFALRDVDTFDMDCNYTWLDITTCDFSWELELQPGSFTGLLYLHDKAGNLDIVAFPLYVDVFDRTPDTFTFAQKNNVARSTVTSSDVAQVVG